jgi:RNA polymerase primary sigma factor
MDEPPPISRKGMTPVLRMAVLAGVMASVKLHLRLGGVVDALDDKGRTPLILAAARGHVEICRFLLDAGADPTHADIEGNDALGVATANGHHAVAELLIAAIPSPPEPSFDQLQTDEVESSSPGWTAKDCDCTIQVASSTIPEDPAHGSVGARSEPTVSASMLETVPHPPAILEGDSSVASLDPDSSHSRQYADEFDLSSWEEETDSPPPRADPNYAKLADEFQRRLSLHTPVDLDEGWDEVDIDLPDVLADVRRRAKLDPEEEIALRQLVLAAVADGRVRGEFLALVAPRDRDDADQPDADYVANLRLTLADMGVVVDDDPDAPDCLSSTDDLDDFLRDEATEGLAFLRNLNSPASDPIAHYISDLPSERLTRDDEVSLSTEIKRSSSAAFAAVAMSPAAVSELLALAEAVFAGKTPISDIRKYEDDEDDNEDDDEEYDEDSLIRRSTVSENLSKSESLNRSELLDQLKTIRDLCRRLSKLWDHGVAERLGDCLVTLGPSPSLVEKLQRSVEKDPNGGEAHRLMEAGTATARGAKERLVVANLKLVVWLARKFGGLAWPDRIQEGNLGLLKAAERFDHRHGAKFSTYATWWIKQAIFRATADTDRTIRVPVHVQDALRKVYHAQRQVFSLMGRDAAPDEIADLTGLPVTSVGKLLAVVEEPLSLNDEAVWCMAMEMASPEPNPEEKTAVMEMKRLVKRQLQLLLPREAAVLRLRFGIDCHSDHTLEEVGELFGVTRERIRQIEAKALKRLRHPARIKILQGCR